MSDDKVQVCGLFAGEPVHARSTDGCIDFAEIVGLTVGGGQSPHMRDIDLLAGVEFGVLDNSHLKPSYRLSIRQAQLLVALDNANMSPVGLYTVVLQQGHIEHRTEETETDKGQRKLTASIDGEAQASLVGFVATWFAKVTAKGHAGIEHAKGREAQTAMTITKQVELVTPGGQGSWNLGGKDGDPRRDTKNLRGAVISGGTDDRLTPLCGLEAKDPNRPVIGTITLRVTRQSLVVEPAENDDPANLDALFKVIEDEAAPFLKRRIKAEKDLRTRVAGLAATRGWPKPRNAREGTADVVHLPFAIEPVVKKGSRGGR